MSVDLKAIGKDFFGGSFAGDLLFGGGGSINTNIVGYSPGGGGQPPLRDSIPPTPESKGGFLAGVRDFINSLTDRPSTNAGAAAGSAFYEKAKPWLVGGAILGGTLLLMKWGRK